MFKYSLPPSSVYAVRGAFHHLLHTTIPAFAAALDDIGYSPSSISTSAGGYHVGRYGGPSQGQCHVCKQWVQEQEGRAGYSVYSNPAIQVVVVVVVAAAAVAVVVAVVVVVAAAVAVVVAVVVATPRGS